VSFQTHPVIATSIKHRSLSLNEDARRMSFISKTSPEPFGYGTVFIRAGTSDRGTALMASSMRSGVLASCWNTIRSRMQRLGKFRRKLIAFALSMFLVFSIQASVLAAPGGYSAGGSFKSRSSMRTSSPPIQRHSPSSRQQYSGRAGPRNSSPRLSVHQRSYYAPPAPRSIHYVHTSAGTVSRRFSPADKAVVMGTGGLIVYGFTSERKRRESELDGPLGPGATAVSLTVALDISDRYDPGNVMNKLKAIADKVDTSRREGIQELISETALELLRNQESITSTFAESTHYKDAGRAGQDFEGKSIHFRSTFESDTVRRFGGKESGLGQVPLQADQFSTKATVGVVSINLAIDGTSTNVMVKSRADMIDALRRIASDAKVEDCLFSGEVLMVPGDSNDELTRKDVYSMYPELIIV